MRRQATIQSFPCVVLVRNKKKDGKVILYFGWIKKLGKKNGGEDSSLVSKCRSFPSQNLMEVETQD